MISVTVTYNRSNPSNACTQWIPAAEYISFIVANYENNGLKSRPVSVFHFPDGRTETLTSENTGLWNENWSVMIKTLTFQNLTAYNNFHAEPLVQENINAETSFYASQGVTFTRTYTGE